MSTPETPATPPTPTPETPNPTPPPKHKSFFAHIWEWLGEHLGSAASFEHTAATAISIAKPLLGTLLALTAGEPSAAKVSKVVDQVTNDLNDTAALLNGAGASGGITLTSALESVHSNLSTLLADAEIKNSTKAEQITGIVNTLLGEIEAVGQAFDQKKAA